MAESIKECWYRFRRELEEVCRQCGRSSQSVTIVGVSKYVDIAQTAELVQAGCHELGESRPQKLWEKAEELHDAAVRWHMIGHLQRNKVRRTVQHMHVLHSLDSIRLAHAISEEASNLGREIDCFVELNISNEAAKTGMALEEFSRHVVEMLDLPAIRLVGFMGMASDAEDDDAIRSQFLALRQIRDDLQNRFGCERHPMSQLSMGMSNDFAIAVQCGATHIRIGSRLFPPSESSRKH
jgi:pyridoxal phosphate enzyme (YggS family)